MSFVPAHSEVASEGASKTAFVLHGVLGSGQNFRGFARKLSQRHPEYRFVLVDLRHHGKSHPAPPPDTLTECARDLIALNVHRTKEQPHREAVSVVLGHSFGGKVALELARLQAADARGSELSSLLQVWALDANPGPQRAGAAEKDLTNHTTESSTPNDEIARVIAAVRSVAVPIRERRDVVTALTDQGLSTGLANWMTTNVVREASNYRWTFDLDRIEVMLEDYFQRDLWPFLEAEDKNGVDTHLVVAERSDRFDPAMRARARQLEQEGRLRVHPVPKAGHWLHVDNPDGLLDVVSRHLA